MGVTVEQQPVDDPSKALTEKLAVLHFRYAIRGSNVPAPCARTGFAAPTATVSPMSFGPVILCDKSAIQSFSDDEAFWLGVHYRTNLCPLFYVEVLADLEKAPPEGRTPEDVVRGLARKVSPMGADPNVFHEALVLGDMLGQRVPMEGKTIRGGSRRIVAADGRSGVAFDEPPEMQAFNRWRRADFGGVEREFAGRWRAMLAELDLGKMADNLFGNRQVSFSDLAAIKRLVDRRLRPKNQRHWLLRAALVLLRIPLEARPAIIARWKAEDGPPLWEFAPYAHYVLTVDTFFALALRSGHIAATRASNKVDMAYLYYLPFCGVFVSADKLHRRVVPLFLRDDQEFVGATDMKADMAKLEAHYSALPADMKETGVINYAAYPPLEGDYLTTRLFDRFLPGWRNHAANPIKLTPEIEAAIMKSVRPMMDAFNGAPNVDAAAPGDDANAPHILKMVLHNDPNRRRLF